MRKEELSVFLILGAIHSQSEPCAFRGGPAVALIGRKRLRHKHTLFLLANGLLDGPNTADSLAAANRYAYQRQALAH